MAYEIWWIEGIQTKYYLFFQGFKCLSKGHTLFNRLQNMLCYVFSSIESTAVLNDKENYYEIQKS